MSHSYTSGLNSIKKDKTLLDGVSRAKNLCIFVLFLNQTHTLMELYLIVFTAGIYKAEQIYRNHQELLMALEKHFTLHLVSYNEADTIPNGTYKMAFIADGEVEDKVLANFSLFPYPITLLADGLYNSLPAAMEIAASIRSKNLLVKIIHGSTQEMVRQVLIHHRSFQAKHALRGKRIGVMGAPAPWLVSSHVDYLLASQRWGVDYIDIPMKEIYKRFYNITDDRIGVEASVFAGRAKACQDIVPEDLLRAMRLYKAVRQLCDELHLDAVTLACDALIHQLNTTGCVALSLLNNEGIPAGCEGDLQAIMTMLMAKVLTGGPGFMGNVSFVYEEQNEILLAHCSIATKMAEEYILRDHFDKRAGVAVQGLLHEGDVTLFKCGGECLDEYYVSEGYLCENTNLAHSCRTQLRLRLDRPVGYFLTNPLGNHHILLQGHHEAVIQDFMKQNRCKSR